MKAVILAGGYGTRISEESYLKPKPMIEIGSKPIIWHIMKYYSSYGINEFIICCGYKSYFIKEYFSNYFLHNSDVTFDMAKNEMHVHREYAENWKVTLIDTGTDSQTGGRLKRIASYLDDEDFCFTYGDGLSDIDLDALISNHKKSNKLATLSIVQPPGRFGSVELEGSTVTKLTEKPLGDGAWINGGFFVLSPKVIDYIDSDSTIWEREPLEALTKESQLNAYQHSGFWHPMDTLRDKRYLDDLWNADKAAWKKW